MRLLPTPPRPQLPISHADREFVDRVMIALIDVPGFDRATQEALTKTALAVYHARCDAIARIGKEQEEEGEG